MHTADLCRQGSNSGTPDNLKFSAPLIFGDPIPVSNGCLRPLLLFRISRAWPEFSAVDVCPNHPWMSAARHYKRVFQKNKGATTGRPWFGSVRLRFGGGTVRAVPVFGPAVPLQKGLFSVSVQLNRKGRFRFQFRILEN